MSDKQQLPAELSRFERGVSVPAEYQPDGNAPAATFATAARSVVADMKDVVQGMDDVSLDLSAHREVDGRITMHLELRGYKHRKNEASK